MTRRPMTREQIEAAIYRTNRIGGGAKAALSIGLPLLLLAIGLIFARALPWMVSSVAGAQ